MAASISWGPTVAITARIGSAVRSLWERGRNRRLGGGGYLTRLWFFNKEERDRIHLSDTEYGYHVSTMSEALLDLVHPMFTRTPSKD